jgi:hypothetical protein
MVILGRPRVYRPAAGTQAREVEPDFDPSTPSGSEESFMLNGIVLSLALAAASPVPPAAADRPISHYLERVVVEPLADNRAVQQPRGDSKKNGAIIGAVIGGVVAGAGIGLLCHAFNDTDEPQCWKATVLWGGIGAGGGAAIGAGIDALFSRRMTFQASVRF